MDDLDKAIAAVLAFGELSQQDVGKAGAMLLLKAHGQLTAGEVNTMIDPLIQSHYVVSGWCKALRMYAQQRAGDAVREAGEEFLSAMGEIVEDDDE